MATPCSAADANTVSQFAITPARFGISDHNVAGQLATAYAELSSNTDVPFVQGDPYGSFVYFEIPRLFGTGLKPGFYWTREFIDYANKLGKPITFASSGVGSDGHLMGEAIALSTKIKVEHVPYRSTSQALTDVVAGHVAFCTFINETLTKASKDGAYAKAWKDTAGVVDPTVPTLPALAACA